MRERAGATEKGEVRVEIPEREWLQAGFFWIALGLLSALPWVGPSIIGQVARLIICLTTVIHIAEAFYSMSIARAANLDPVRWALRSLVLGFLALRRLRELASSGAHPL